MKILQLTDFPNAEFEVSIVSKNNSVHRVFLSEKYYQELTQGQIEPHDLIERSFSFLLEREPNTAILSEFNLRKISEFFPEFEQEIKVVL